MNKINLVMFFLMLNSFSICASIPAPNPSSFEKEENKEDYAHDGKESDKDEDEDQDDCESSFTPLHRVNNDSAASQWGLENLVDMEEMNL